LEELLTVLSLISTSSSKYEHSTLTEDPWSDLINVKQKDGVRFCSVIYRLEHIEPFSQDLPQIIPYLHGK